MKILAAPCPVAELERKINTATEKLDAAERTASSFPTSSLEQLLADNAEDYVSALREMVSHTLATSAAGLRCQIGELVDAQEELLRDDTDKAARKVDRLVGLIAQAAESLLPSEDMRLAA